MKRLNVGEHLSGRRVHVFQCTCVLQVPISQMGGSERLQLGRIIPREPPVSLIFSSAAVSAASELHMLLSRSECGARTHYSQQLLSIIQVSGLC